MKRYRPMIHLLIAITAIVPMPVLGAEKIDFDREIAPLLSKRCLECHNAADAKGGLRLTTRDLALVGGESGKVLVPSRPDHSLMLKRVKTGEMPPVSRGQSQKLPDHEIALLRRWIAEGATWPADRTIGMYDVTTDVRAGRDWWSLQPIRRPQVPQVKTRRVANPIDAFIHAGLEEVALSMAPPADRRYLVRRAFFDLIGLPPTPRQVDQFLTDDSPQAYERLVDRLLHSPRYGERWARYWLDLVRFAETCGYERDQLKPGIWRYRDWVIRALNPDMPYDRFVTEQLAGDEVVGRNEQTVIATGMLRAGTWNDEPNDAADYLYERLDDMVHTTSSAFLGLTVKCARCHDHKFDPIPQRDYYRIASFFWAGYIGQGNLGGPDAKQLGFDGKPFLDKSLDPVSIFGWTDRAATADPIHLLKNGDRHHPGPVVEPGFLSAVPVLDRPLRPSPSDSNTTQRRLQYAQWITDAKNPLAARVLVNRLWQHHFGQAIVRTPNNFGFKSAAPTHPKLLDFLAAELIDGGWSIKRAHKLIMMSQTYRQASTHPEGHEYEQVDFLNRLWWRQNRRRLDAEALRDSMLAVSGRLHLQMGGPSFFPQMSEEALEGLSTKSSGWGNSPPDQRVRRSIYMMSKRSRLLPFMTTFDFCDTTLSCGQRDVTVVAPQALALLNNQLVHEISEAMARRVVEEVGNQKGAAIRRAWQLAFSREPSASEATAAARHMEMQRAYFEARENSQQLAFTSLCHVLLNTNEFIYVD